MSSPLETVEVRELKAEVFENERAVNAACKAVEDHIFCAIDEQFSKESISALRVAEKKEEVLERKRVALLNDLYMAKQARRRKFLLAETAKSGTGGSNVLAQSVSSKLKSVVSGGFGFSSRCVNDEVLRENPFLDNSVKLLEGPGQVTFDHDISTWLVAKEEITCSGEVLGKGTFGAVYKGTLRGKPVAVKCIAPKWDSDSEVQEVLDAFRNECAVMSKLLHPNVLLLMGVCIEENGAQSKLILVTELMPRGSVYDLIHPTDSKKKILFKQRMKFAKDTAFGMNWLHLARPPVLHLDLKTQNILVDKNWVAKVADFGLSRVKQLEKNKGVKGSPIYMAPEVLSRKPYDEKADVYSYGIILWELITGANPFQEQLFEDFSDVYNYVVVENERPVIPNNTPPALARLIRKCWHSDPAKRPSFAQILDKHVLDDVIVDAIISPNNTLGRTFWKTSFSSRSGTHEVVGWHKFISTLVHFCDIEVEDKSDLERHLGVKALKQILVETKDDEDVVTIERFSKVLEWCGPFSADQAFLANVTQIVKIPGFYGEMSGSEAEQLMAKKRSGYYMIRFSGQQPGFYTITTMAADNTLKHFRIKHKAGLGFVLGEQEYPTLEALISANRKELKLKHALKDSKYAALVAAHELDVKGNYVSMFHAPSTFWQWDNNEKV